MHFASIIENPGLAEHDLFYPEEGTGDNPIMVAAKLRNKDVLNAFLRSNKFDENCDTEFLGKVMHFKNDLGHTLLHTVALQVTINLHSK